MPEGDKTNVISIRFEVPSFRKHYTNVTNFRSDYAQVSSLPLFVFAGVGSDEVHFENGYISNFTTNMASMVFLFIGKYLIIKIFF